MEQELEELPLIRILLSAQWEWFSCWNRAESFCRISSFLLWIKGIFKGSDSRMEDLWAFLLAVQQHPDPECCLLQHWVLPDVFIMPLLSQDISMRCGIQFFLDGIHLLICKLLSKIQSLGLKIILIFILPIHSILVGKKSRNTSFPQIFFRNPQKKWVYSQFFQLTGGRKSGKVILVPRETRSMVKEKTETPSSSWEAWYYGGVSCKKD